MQNVVEDCAFGSSVVGENVLVPGLSKQHIARRSRLSGAAHVICSYRQTPVRNGDSLVFELSSRIEWSGKHVFEDELALSSP
jgi:hypothetical protein